MKRILVVGCGDVAQRAIPWLVRRFRVFALVRRPDAAAEVRRLGAVPVVGDLDDRRSLSRLAGVADAVLHFAPPPTQGKTDPRTRHLLAALASRGSLPQHLIYISTTGVYGDCGGASIDETRPCRPQTPRAQRRVDAERQLRAFGRRTGVAVCLLRAPGIYAADRLPLERIRRGAPVLNAAEDVHTNHIHADDLARLAVCALFRGRSGRVYNAVDDTRLQMGAYFDVVADTFGLARPPRVSRAEIVGLLSPMTLSFMAESRRIGNERIRRDLCIELRYPTVIQGLNAARQALDGLHPPTRLTE